MSGKSNILDVFGFLSHVFFPQAGTQGVSYAFAQRGGVNEVLWKGGDEKLISIALTGMDPTDGDTKYSYELELIAGAGDYVNIHKEALRFSSQGDERDLIVPGQGTVTFRNLDGKDQGSVGLSGTSALQYATPTWDGYRFYQWVRLWRFHHLVPPLMKQSSLMSLGQVLTTTGDNLSAWLMWLQAHSPEALARVNEVLRDLFPDLIQVNLIPTPDGRVHLATKEKGLKRPSNVWQASDGLLAATALLSLIYVPAELSGTLFCIEEPENHLHPRILATLVKLLRQVRQEVVAAKASPTQILLTTQSPYLVDQFLLDEIIWVEKKNGETNAYRPAGKEHLRKLVEDQELGLGDLMYTGALGEET